MEVQKMTSESKLQLKATTKTNNNSNTLNVLAYVNKTHDVLKNI